MRARRVVNMDGVDSWVKREGEEEEGEEGEEEGEGEGEEEGGEGEEEGGEGEVRIRLRRGRT